MTRVSYIPVKGIKPNRGKQVTVAEFRRMWGDEGATQPASPVGAVVEAIMQEVRT